MPTEAVLDSSAILAVILDEPGWQNVEAVHRSWVSAVNLTEVVRVMARRGLDIAEIEGAPFAVEPFDQSDALEAGRLIHRTRAHGLSLGDCACLALGKRLNLPVLTADRAWAALDLGVEVVLIR